MLYRIITSGNNQRREYLGLNHSPLFQDLPNKDFGEEQKLSFDNFLRQGLKKIFATYFPAEFSNYNNLIHCEVKEVRYEEPKNTANEARVNGLTWNYAIFLLWSFVWDCHKIQIPLTGGEIKEDVQQWVEKSFKLRKFDLREKIPGEKWEIKEKKKTTKKNETPERDKEIRITVEKTEQRENFLTAKVRCVGEKEINFCYLPKITPSGSFIVNGHNKVAVYQSVRAPAVYFFATEEKEIYGEIIPFKGPWISLTANKKKPGVIEIKFLNSGLVLNFLDLLKTHDVSAETITQLFAPEDLNTENYAAATILEPGVNAPNFLFTKPNTYFTLGQLGRRKYNQKSLLSRQVVGQTLAEDLYDISGKLLLKKNTILEGKDYQKLSQALTQKKISPLTLPFSVNDLYVLQIKAPHNPEKIISVVGFGEELPETKIYFDLADLVCAVSLFFNLRYGLGNLEKEEEKDTLENQVIRRAGDLIYNLFENKMGNWLTNISNKYLAALSQFKKADLTKIPNLKDFDNLLRVFFNISPLVQLRNENNSLSMLAYLRKLSLLGTGGFSSSNTTFAARNVKPSQINCLDLVDTPEGQNVGVVRNFTIQAKINDYGQPTAPYYPVEAGLISPKLIYLTNEEVKNKYVIHCNLKINENNQIQEEKVLARFQDDLVWVDASKINYIDTSFYQLNSVTSATIPFFQHNDATRMLMASNMQRQAVPLLRSQEPWVASGIESNVAACSPLAVRAEKKGTVDYVDSQKIIIKESARVKKTYQLSQLVASNKNTLNFSTPLVKKGDLVEKEQIIANASYIRNGELALGQNLRVAYCCWEGYNFEDAIVISDRLVKEDILTSFFVKKYTIIRYHTKHGEEVFTNLLPHLDPKDPKKEDQERQVHEQITHLDQDGIVKVGSRVKAHDILVGKRTPQPRPQEESEEEALLLSILGEASRKFVDSSLYLPTGEKGEVYEVRRKKLTKNRRELEVVEVYVAQERKIEAGDKQVDRYGYKGVIAKIVPAADLPYDEEGKTFDILINPLGIPSRLNIGKLLETILAEAAYRLNSKFLVRPFNTLSPQIIKQIMQEAGISPNGTRQLFNGRTGLPFAHPVYTGYTYIVKLNHMVADKVHQQNRGPRSLVTRQPLRGRSQGGCQRYGNMEIEAAIAHGLAANLMELTGAKSDDIHESHRLQNALTFSERPVRLRNSNKPESFNMTIQYLRAIGFDIQATDYYDKEIDFYKYFAKK